MPVAFYIGVKAHYGYINVGKNRSTRNTTYVQFLTLRIWWLLIVSIAFGLIWEELI
jgi:hypothetical protein